MNVAAIPAELRALDQWVAWKAVPNEAKGKPDKVPFQAVNTTVKASSTDRGTWAPFEQAVATLDRPGIAGVGFVLTREDSFVGIDLDKVLRDGVLNGSELAGATVGTWVGALSTYTEISPSGTGLRIIGRGQFPEKGRKKGNIEAYSAERFLTITGNVFEGLGVLRDVPQDVLDAFHRAAFPPKPDPKLVAIASRSAPVTVDDRELLERAMRVPATARSSSGSGTVTPAATDRRAKPTRRLSRSCTSGRATTPAGSTGSSARAASIETSGRGPTTGRRRSRRC